jgi:hypothetical protein
VSVFGSIQQSRFSELAPLPGSPTYFLELRNAAAVSIHEVFVLLAVVAAICILPALLVTGRLPDEAEGKPADGPGEPAVAH